MEKMQTLERRALACVKTFLRPAIRRAVTLMAALLLEACHRDAAVAHAYIDHLAAASVATRKSA